MGYYLISKETLQCELKKYQGLNDNYQQFYNDFMAAANSDLQEAFQILSEVLGAISNLKFVLSKIPGSPSGGGGGAAVLGDILPIDNITNTLIKAGASVSGGAPPAGGTSTTTPPPPSSSPQSAQGATALALSNVCAQACQLGGSTGAVGQILNQIRAQLNSSSATVAALNIQVVSAGAKFTATVPLPPPFVPPPVDGPPPPPPPLADPSIFDALSNQISTLLMQQAQALDDNAFKLDGMITNLENEIYRIKQIIQQVYDIIKMIKAFIDTAKKNILSITKFLITLEKALKALVLATFIFPLSIVLAAQMAGWIGIIGQIMALIEGLLGDAKDKMLEAEDKSDSAAGAKNEQDVGLEGIKSTLDAHKTCFQTAKQNDLILKLAPSA